MNRSIHARILRIAPTLGLAAALGGEAAGQALEQQQLTPALGTTTQKFGRGVSTRGDVLVAGSPEDDTNGANAGAAYVYRFDATTQSFAFEQQLMPGDPEAGAEFGWQTAVEGDVAVVSARNEDNAKGTDAGAVYIFRRNGSTGVWSQEQKLTPSVGASDDEFGYSLALAGNVLLVGAPYADTTNGVNSGLVYVYRWKNSIVKWAEETTLLDPDGATGNNAGYAVAFDGANAAVGSPLEYQGGVFNVGSIGVWNVSGTTWTQTAELSPAGNPYNVQFGTSVGIDGNEVVGGAPYYSTASATYCGACYFFSKRTGSWVQEGPFVNPDPSYYDAFGLSAAMDGKLAVVGSHLDDAFGRADSGAAWTFRLGKGNKGWFLDQELAASDGSNSDYFATTLACSDEHIVTGGSHNDTASGTDWGVVYCYDADEINLKITPTQPTPGETIHVSIYDGDENAPVLLVIDEIDGTPVWVEVVLYVFGGDHRLTFDVDAENPLVGVTIGVTAWKISPTGPLVHSDRVHVDV